MTSKKEPLILRARNVNSSVVSNLSHTEEAPGPNSCCGAGGPFFAARSPSRTVGSENEKQTARTEDHCKSSIHSIARKKSPFKMDVSGSMVVSKGSPPLPPNREAEELHKRCAIAESRLAETLRMQATLDMEKKQLMEAYQQLRAGAENEKRLLLRTIEELKSSGETHRREMEVLRA